MVAARKCVGHAMKRKSGLVCGRLRVALRKRKTCPGSTPGQVSAGEFVGRGTPQPSQILIRKPVIIDVVSTLVPVPAKPNFAFGLPGKLEAKPFFTMP
jgi:hypothetical protein